MSAPRRLHGAVTLVIALVIAPVIGVATADWAGAVGGGGGTGASGRGDTIISTILRGGGRGGANHGSGATPRCAWHSISDSQAVFLLYIAASMPELHDSALFAALEPHLASGLSPGFDLQVMMCDGEPRTDQVRVRPSLVPTDVASAARRQMRTILPPPAAHTTPPGPAAALVNQPVFFSIDPLQWGTTVHSTLTDGGRTVEVVAHPSDFEVYTGEVSNADGLLRCAGAGRAWDPSVGTSPAAQAAAPGACTVRYTRATGTRGRRDSWFGYVRLNWEGMYRVDTGPWVPLDGLFSFRVIRRSVRELDTVIETP